MQQSEALEVNPFGADIVTEPRTIETSVNSVNGEALHEVVQRFARLRASFGQSAEVMPNVLLVQSAEPGYGKSHLIGRVFLELNRVATLLYVRAFQDPASPWLSLLETIVQELDYPARAGAVTRAPGEPSQLDVLTRRVLLALTRTLIDRGKLKGVKGADLVKFPNAMFETPEWRAWLAEERGELVRASDNLLSEQGVALSPNRQAWLKVLIAYAFSEEDALVRQTCLDWLRYQPIEPEEGRQIGLRLADLPDLAPSNEQRNERCFRRIQDLFKLGAYYQPFLLCFDQTELYGRDGSLARSFGVVLSRLRREAKNHVTIVTANQFVWENQVRRCFDVADQHSIQPQPINLEGVDEAQARELLLARLWTWKQEANRGRINGYWLSEMFRLKSRWSAREVLREASVRWESALPVATPIEDVFESYRARLLADPKRLDFHAGVLQRVAQLVLGPAAGAQVEVLTADNRYLRLRWRLPDARQVLLGFEPGSHWKTWEAIVHEAAAHYTAAREVTHVVLLRTGEQRELAERNLQQLAKAPYLRLMTLPREHAALLYAADELYADALQGDQSYSEADVLAYCRTRVAALVDAIVDPQLPQLTATEAGGRTESLANAMREIVHEHTFITLALTRERLAQRGVQTSRDAILAACAAVPQIRVFASPSTVVLRWTQSV